MYGDSAQQNLNGQRVKNTNREQKMEIRSKPVSTLDCSTTGHYESY
jgi:hypothetical protein